MSPSEIENALEWRYATKQFDPNKRISEGDWKVLEKSLLLSPSSYGLQPWKFLVVQNAELRAKLKTVSWNQSQVVDCSHYVVFLHKEKVDEQFVKEHIARISEVRQLPLESLAGYQNAILGDVVNGPRAKVLEPWAQRQSYIAMGFLMETAALLQIDACPMEGLDANAYDEILGLKGSSFKTVASVALGYRHANDKYQNAKKVRFPLERMIQFIN